MNYGAILKNGNNVNGENMSKNDDRAVDGLIKKEENRQNSKIELIASENFVSRNVLEATGSILTNKYAEGYPGKRYYGGCEFIDEIESLAIDRLKKLYGADQANVQPHSGSQANMAVYQAILKPGDLIMGLNLSSGGHLTHGAPASFSGQIYQSISYGLNPDTELLDYRAIEKLALKNRPKMIVAGASAYSRVIDFQIFSAIAKKINAYLLVDMAHIAGLVATGAHPSPIKYADFVTSTTHKTLRGPRGGFILCKEEYAKAVNKAIFPGIQGGPLEHVIAAKAVAFGEALKPSFTKYINQVIINCKTLAIGLGNEGFKIVSGGTDNHLFLLKLDNLNLTGKRAEAILEEVGITVNRNAIPNDPLPLSLTSGIRIGTAAVTTKGLKEAEMEEIAKIITLVLSNTPSNKVTREAKRRIKGLCSSYTFNN